MSRGQRTSSPLADREISFIDDSSVDSSPGGSNASSSSTTSSNSASDDEAYPSTLVAEISLSSANSSAPATARAFSSDSGFVLIFHQVRVPSSYVRNSETLFTLNFLVVQVFFGNRRSKITML